MQNSCCDHRNFDSVRLDACLACAMLRFYHFLLKDQNNYAKVVRVVIAGNSLSSSTRNKQNEAKAKYLTRNAQAQSVDAMKNLDECLAQLAVSRNQSCSLVM
jgi:hypothetical protein